MGHYKRNVRPLNEFCRYGVRQPDGSVLVVKIHELDVMATDVPHLAYVHKFEPFCIDKLPSYGPADVRELLKSDSQAQGLLQMAWASGLGDALSVYKYLKVYLHHSKSGMPRPFIDDLRKVVAGVNIADCLEGWHIHAVRNRDLYYHGSWDEMVKRIEERLAGPAIMVDSLEDLAKDFLEKVTETDEARKRRLDAVKESWKADREMFERLNYIEKQANLNLSDFVLY